MRILITILFVVFIAFGGFAKEQCNAIIKTKLSCDFVTENQLTSPEVFQVIIYEDQDSNESNTISLFFTERMQLPKPTCLDAKSVILPHRSLPHFSLSNLLIDLPPPAIFQLF